MSMADVSEIVRKLEASALERNRDTIASLTLALTQSQERVRELEGLLQRARHEINTYDMGNGLPNSAIELRWAIDLALSSSFGKRKELSGKPDLSKEAEDAERFTKQKQAEELKALSTLNKEEEKR